MRSVFFILTLALGLYVAHGQVLPAPYRLRCELLLHTGKVSSRGMEVKESLAKAAAQKDKWQFVNIISPQPVFNWETAAAIKQPAACHILVASSQQLLNKDQADYWDSGKMLVSSGRVVYAGKPLLPGKIYYWKLQCWDGTNRPSAYSSSASFYQTVPGSAETFSHYPLAAELQKPGSVIKKADGSYFLDFGKDAFAQLQLNLSSDRTDSIWIEAAEALESPGNIRRMPGNIRYIKRGLFIEKGTHDYTVDWPADAKRNSRNPILMPDYIGEVFPFRYVVISNFTGKINKGSVERKIIFYPFDDTAAAFSSSDTVLNKVWDLCKYSIKATSFSGNYVDGDRERVPYEADALINQLSHYSVDAEYSMARRSMVYLLFHPTWPTEWSLQNILLAWNDYLYTGDDAFLRKYYAELQKKILMPLAGPNGLISTRAKKQEDAFLESIHMVKDFDGKHGLKDNVDWPQTGSYIGSEKEYGGETDGFVYTDYNAVINAYYYRCLQLMQKISTVLDKKEEAAFYEQKAKEVYASFQFVFRDKQSGLIKDGDTTLHTSLHANMFALAFGLVPAADAGPVIKFIKTRKMACSVYGAQFLLDALYDAGEANYALELLTATTRRSWYNMLRTGSTITMEAWDKLYKPNLDLNHAWGAAPANIIVRKLMGVEPLTPGAETIRIKPQLGNLRFASLRTTTLKGVVLVSCKRNADADRMEVSIPGGSSAEICMAYNPGKTHLSVDGKPVSIRPYNGFYTIKKILPGKHVFTLQ